MTSVLLTSTLASTSSNFTDTAKGLGSLLLTADGSKIDSASILRAGASTPPQAGRDLVQYLIQGEQPRCNTPP